MEIRKCCNQLFVIRGTEELILADATARGSHNSEQDKLSIWSKTLLLMEKKLWILTGFQSLQKNLLSPQEKFYWKRFYKICRAVGTRSSFSVRWFVSLDFLRICCASNIPNERDQWIELRFTSGQCYWSFFPHLVSKVFHDLKNKSRRAGAWLTCSRHKCHFW